MPQAIAEDVKNFLSNYTEENAVLLPGRIPGFKNEDIVLLLSSETKMHVWNCFKNACEVASKRVVSYTKFIELWKQLNSLQILRRTFEQRGMSSQATDIIIQSWTSGMSWKGEKSI